jgi:hypothetical protein
MLNSNIWNPMKFAHFVNIVCCSHCQDNNFWGVKSFWHLFFFVFQVFGIGSVQVFQQFQWMREWKRWGFEVKKEGENDFFIKKSFLSKINVKLFWNFKHIKKIPKNSTRINYFKDKFNVQKFCLILFLASYISYGLMYVKENLHFSWHSSLNTN